MTQGVRIIEPSVSISVRIPIRLLPKIEHLEGRNRSDRVKRLIEWATSAQAPQQQTTP